MAEKIQLDLLINSAGFAKSIGDAKNQVLELNKALKDPANVDAYDKLEKALGKAKGQFGDFRKEIDLLDPDKKAQAFINLGQSMAGGFAVATGAIGLFGKQSKLVEEAQKRAQSAIALLQGIQALANAKDDIAAVKRILGWKATTAAVNQTTVATEGQTVATETATVASKLLKGALAATGIGLLLVAVGALIANFDTFKKKIENLIPGLGLLFNAFGKIADAVGELFTTDSDKQTALLEQTSKNLKRRIAEEEAAGKDTFELKKQQLGAELQLLEQANGKETDEYKDKYSEFQQLLNAHTKEVADTQQKADDEAQKNLDKKNEENIQKQKDFIAKQKELDKQLRDARTANVTDDREKQIEGIQNEFTDKIAAITGNSQKEQDLRDQIELQMFNKVQGMKQQFAQEDKNAADALAQKTLEEIKKRGEEEFQQTLAVEKKIADGKLNALKSQLASGQISQTQFDEQSVKLTAETLQTEKETYQNYGKDVTDIDGQILDGKIANNQKEIDEETKKAETKKQLQQDFFNSAVAVAGSLLQAYQEFAKRRADSELAAIQETHDAAISAAQSQFDTQSANDKALLDSKTISQSELDKREKKRQADLAKQKAKIDDDARKKEAKIREDAFRKDKAAKIIEATIATALAVVNGLSKPAVPPFPSAIAAGIAGATQIGLIASQAIPKFASGGRVRGAGTATSDSIPAWLSDGEFIVNARSTRSFLPLLEAINNRPPLRFADGGQVGSQSANASTNVLEEIRGILHAQSQTDKRVFVVESDITSKQGRVSVLESRATIG